MKVTISAKDTTAKLELKDVNLYWQEGGCFSIRFTDGRIRMYPQIHIWYLEISP